MDTGPNANAPSPFDADQCPTCGTRFGESGPDTCPPQDCTFNTCRIDRAEQIQLAKLEWEFTADSVPQLMFLLDCEDRVLRANRTLEHWGLGHVVGVMGRNMHDLVHPDCVDAECPLRDVWKNAAGTNAQDFAVEYQFEDKQLDRFLNLHFRVHRSTQNREVGFIVAVISDISDLKRAELKLQEVNNELERRIEESTFALISSNIRLQLEIEQHKRIEEALERSREEYSQLVEAMDEGLAILDKEGRITYVNKPFCDALGRDRDRVLGMMPTDFAVAESRAALVAHMEERRCGGMSTYVANLQGKDGHTFWVKISPTQMFEKRGESSGSFAVITEDIEQHSVVQWPHKPDAEPDDSYDNLPYGYHTLDSSGIFIKINNTKAKWLGYTREEMIGKMRFVDILTPASVLQYETCAPRLETAGYLREIEVELVRKNGTILPALFNAVAIRDAEGRFVMSRGIVYDISYRKNAEQALRESEHTKRLLAAQVMAAQEKERKRIASELHDGIGQTLSAIKFYVENALRNLNEHTVENSAQMFRNTIPKLQDAIEEVRRISMDLRPSLLDDIGTLATLSWFCREYQSIYDAIRVDLSFDIEESDIPAPLKIAIFRIVQEAMNNCAKYGKADKILVSLVNSGQEIRLAVQDNGQGFDYEEVCAQRKNAGHGMGLVSMRERAEFTGGIFSIQSARDQGTRMSVAWPHHAQESA